MLKSPVTPHDSEQICRLNIRQLRRDSGTQGRVGLVDAIVEEYACFMSAGIQFPPVIAWTDGTTCWLTDGFHRVAAAERLGELDITVELRFGDLRDAQWDSYGANSTHGLRRSRADVEHVIQSALRHPNVADLSNNQISRHLGIPESTLRRWRTRLGLVDKKVCIVTRSGSTYKLNTSRIGKAPSNVAGRGKTKRELQAQLMRMRDLGSPGARRILNIINSWAFGRTPMLSCLASIEDLIREWNSKDGQC
jgi:hypothetical protein